MAAPLVYKARVRLRDEPPRGAPARRFSPLAMPVAAYWVGAGLFSYGIMSGALPIRRWVEESEAAEARTTSLRPERRAIDPTATERHSWAAPAREAPSSPPAPVQTRSLQSSFSTGSPAARDVGSEEGAEPATEERTRAALYPVPTAAEPAQGAEVAPPLTTVAKRDLRQADRAAPEPTPETPSHETTRASTPAASSCEAALDAYQEEVRMSGSQGPPDISREAYAEILEHGAYLLRCGVPDSMSLEICAAIQHGRAVGITVVTEPRNLAMRSCVASVVRGLSFPSHRRLDVTRTRFEAQR